MKCPMALKLDNVMSCNNIKLLEEHIKKYWNEEIEVDI